MHRTVATLLAASLLASSADARAASLPNARPGMLLLAPAAGAPGAAASTGETETFESLVGQATGKFKEKDYAGAVALFERAYAVQPEPAILFNIGRIYEEAQNAEAAIGYYEKFIADQNVEAKDQEKAVQRLTVLRTIVEIREKEKARTQPKPVEPKPVAEPVPVAPQPVAQQPGGDQKPAKPGRVLRPLGFTLVGTGAALLIGGAVVGGLAKAQHGEFAKATDLDLRRDAAARGQSLARTTDGLLIAGGVVAVLGVVMLIVPAARKSRAVQALSPRVSPTHVGLGFTHQF
jgi:tetratricopeptide (TPR) repeat protein